MIEPEIVTTETKTVTRKALVKEAFPGGGKDSP